MKKISLFFIILFTLGGANKGKAQKYYPFTLRIVDNEGNPLDSAKVAIQQLGYSPILLSDEDGLVDFSKVPEGKIKYYITHKSYINKEYDFNISSIPEDNNLTVVLILEESIKEESQKKYPLTLMIRDEKDNNIEGANVIIPELNFLSQKSNNKGIVHFSKAPEKKIEYIITHKEYEAKEDYINISRNSGDNTRMVKLLPSKTTKSLIKGKVIDGNDKGIDKARIILDVGNIADTTSTDVFGEFNVIIDKSKIGYSDIKDFSLKVLVNNNCTKASSYLIPLDDYYRISDPIKLDCYEKKNDTSLMKGKVLHKPEILNLFKSRKEHPLSNFPINFYVNSKDNKGSTMSETDGSFEIPHKFISNPTDILYLEMPTKKYYPHYSIKYGDLTKVYFKRKPRRGLIVGVGVTGYGGAWLLENESKKKEDEYNNSNSLNPIEREKIRNQSNNLRRVAIVTFWVNTLTVALGGEWWKKVNNDIQLYPFVDTEYANQLAYIRMGVKYQF